MATVIAGLPIACWLSGAGVLVRLLHVRAWRIESADLGTPEQMYRLHRLIILGVAVTGGYAVVGLGAFAYLSLAIDDRYRGHWVALSVIVAGTLSCVVPMIAAVRVTRRSYARVRGGAIREHGRRYVLVLTAGAAVLVAVGIAVVRAVLPSRGVWHVAGMLALYLVVLVVVQMLIPPLVVVLLLSLIHI